MLVFLATVNLRDTKKYQDMVRPGGHVCNRVPPRSMPAISGELGGGAGLPKHKKLQEEFDVLNRAALLLRYKAPAVRWINDVDPNPSATPVTLEDVNSERTVYLISDEDADSADAVRNWVEVNFRALFENELEAWYTDPDLWPSPLSLELFDEWFAVECHSVVLDTVGGAIVDDEI